MLGLDWGVEIQQNETLDVLPLILTVACGVVGDVLEVLSRE